MIGRIYTRISKKAIYVCVFLNIFRDLLKRKRKVDNLGNSLHKFIISITSYIQINFK